MKLKLFLAAALSCAFLSQAQAQSDDCAAQLVRVDDLLAAQSDEVNAEVLDQILALRNQGAEDCAAGDEDAASESLEQAISLFTQ